MSMIEWAEREVAIACKRENPNRKEGEWDYGCACYESALKAFKSLMEDGHSGFSIGITKQILNRLITGRPLTPIEDTPDVWNDITTKWEDATEYQCKRMSSLFKTVKSDGTISYHDNDSCVGVYIDDPDICFHSYLVSKINREIFPITMPYTPSDNPRKFFCEEFLTDPKNGDFDTVGIIYMKDTDGGKVDINRYFTESHDKNNPWREISEEEYLLLKSKQVKKGE